MYAIEFQSVFRHFGSVKAVDGVDLAVEHGEFFAMLGPSGSGKTTCLRMIAGFDHPTSGKIELYGKDVTALAPYERDVNTVFQDYALFPHMSVADNIGYGLMIRKVDAAERRRRVDEMLELVRLPGFGARKPAQLSGGQRQRVALARALAIEPRVLLLDEPFGALDARVRKELRRWLREIHKQTGLTTVFVTHDQDEAMDLADRVVVLNEGRIEQVGTPEDLYDRPASPFVISFVGEAIALPVSIKEGQVTFGGRELHVDAQGVRGGEAKVYFRPADIAVVRNGHGELEGRVEAVRRTPSGVRATIAIDGYDQVLEIDAPTDSGATPGTRIPLTLSKARLFPSDPGVVHGEGEGI